MLAKTAAPPPNASPGAIPVARPARRRFRQTRAYAAALRVALSYLWFDAVARVRGPGWAGRRRTALHRRNGRRVREAVLRLRGLFIKAGQLASVLTQLLPESFREELEGLQDRVPAGPPDAVRARIREELGDEPEALFASFGEAPVASASLAQVHRARMPDGRDVAVKVQHVDIEAIARIDLKAIETILRVVGRWFGVRGLREQFREIESAVLAELDFEQEAGSAEAIGAVLGPGVSVPTVVRERSARRVLTTEYMDAVKAGDLAALDAAGVDRAALAERILDAYGGMIFRDGLYHADPHPGNLLVQPLPAPPASDQADAAPPSGDESAGDGLGPLSPTPPPAGERGGEAPSPLPITPPVVGEGDAGGAASSGAGRPFELVFLDFGAVARLTTEMRSGLAEMIAGVLARDAGRVTAALGLMGFVAERGRGGAADAAVLALVERVHERVLQGVDPDAFRLGDLTLEFAMETHADTFGDMADLGVSVGDLASAFRVPRDWILLERTALLLIGLCTTLDPDANPLRVLRPHIEPLVGDLDVGGVAADRAQSALRTALALPARLDRVLTAAEAGTLAVRAPDALRAADRVYAGLRQVAYAVGATGAGGVAYAAHVGGEGGLALGLGVLSGACALGALGSALRERRRAG
ncbi:AarF/UbiB family protein [Rubrivirga sp. S365]|uniref:ABC1 kinase family protein n=1 Tax=Rubrivirga sp. S365 TaxID=3076080 RepID=UPI0028C870CF|nr:AarF/UbiB family protein [Rubrivirga sp. S365]MDT7856566.1 AarF/UbiB family protein [Rubrivirga sp. S365]